LPVRKPGALPDRVQHVSANIFTVKVNLPLVAVEDTHEAEIPVVAVDQVAGAVAATRLLLELGHRTVSHIAGPRDWLSARRRVEGWRAAL
jgi:DNA-binding LacI/PurR family transcriptional regulator